MNLRYIYFAFFTIWAHPTLAKIFPVAVTKHGIVVGSTKKILGSNRTYFAYRGIPYAQPPIGNLRFKAPEPPKFWFIKNAKKDSPFCIQKDNILKNPRIQGQEDCLYLNIYVPKTGKILQHWRKLPVLVFIHWGGFFAGRATSDVVGPEYLMDKNIILVTLNYRLGIMGFFSTMDDNAPGNFGLKDQSLALKFIKENIWAFGGDPNRITISGQSVGGTSVGLHLVSPMSRGLFNQAVSVSALGSSAWLKSSRVLQGKIIQNLANFTNCGYTGDNGRLVKCLRKIPAKDLVATNDKFKYFWVEPAIIYGIVIEQKTPRNPKPFITKNPIEYWRNKQAMTVPYMVGLVQNEGNLFIQPMVRQPSLRDTLNLNFGDIISKILLFPENCTCLMSQVLDLYFGGVSGVNITNPGTIQNLVNLFSDKMQVSDTVESILLQAKAGHAPIWVYNFNYRGVLSYGNLFAGTNETVPFDWGVGHGDDVLSLFRSKALFPELPSKDRVLVDFWTDFVTYGNPAKTQHDVQWDCLHFSSLDEIKNENLNFLNISGGGGVVEFQSQTGFYPERMKFWAGAA